MALHGEDWPEPNKPTVNDAVRISMNVEDGRHAVTLDLSEYETMCSQEHEYSALLRHVYKGPDILFVCFSKKHRASFERVQHYCSEIRAVREDARIHLLGVSWAEHIVWDDYGQNGWEYAQSDLRQVEPSVAEAEAKQLCAQLKLESYFECCDAEGDAAALPEALRNALASAMRGALNQRRQNRPRKKCVIS